MQICVTRPQCVKYLEHFYKTEISKIHLTVFQAVISILTQTYLNKIRKDLERSEILFAMGYNRVPY